MLQKREMEEGHWSPEPFKVGSVPGPLGLAEGREVEVREVEGQMAREVVCQREVKGEKRGVCSRGNKED